MGCRRWQSLRKLRRYTGISRFCQPRRTTKSLRTVLPWKPQPCSHDTRERDVRFGYRSIPTYGLSPSSVVFFATKLVCRYARLSVPYRRDSRVAVHTQRCRVDIRADHSRAVRPLPSYAQRRQWGSAQWLCCTAGGRSSEEREWCWEEG